MYILFTVLFVVNESDMRHMSSNHIQFYSILGVYCVVIQESRVHIYVRALHFGTITHAVLETL